MRRLRQFAFRYRIALLALLVSAAIHAALIVGFPGRAGTSDEGAEAIYMASLDGTAATDAKGPTAVPAPAPPKPRARPRARKPAPPRPEEIVARAPAPPPTAVEESTPAAEPDLPLEPDLPPEPPPDKIALAPVTAPPPPPPEPEPFPTHALPRRLKVTYNLTSAFADGRATYEWERDGDEYVISGEAEAVGFFTLFLEGQVLQESRGKVTAEGLRPDRFTESKPKSPPEGLEFDWSHHKVVFDRNGEKTVAELKDDTVDWLTMIFQLAHRPPKGEAFTLRVFTQRRMYEFHLKVLGEEEIEIPIGNVRALHLRHVDEEKNEYVDVWLGVEQHYMPVKLRYPVARNRFMVEQTAARISER